LASAQEEVNEFGEAEPHLILTEIIDCLLKSFVLEIKHLLLVETCIECILPQLKMLRKDELAVSSAQNFLFDCESELGLPGSPRLTQLSLHAFCDHLVSCIFLID
jgi:hypothetical protein